MLKSLLIFVFFIFVSQFSQAQESAATQKGDFIRLVAALDEPEYYCLDLTGFGDHLVLDDPLQAHTCKGTGIATDQMFYFEEDRLKVAGYDRCLQAVGSGETTLAGSAVIARTCTDNSLQEFSLNATGKIQLNNTPFCLGVGSESTAASGPSHVWRTLHIAKCGSVDNKLSTWQIGL